MDIAAGIDARNKTRKPLAVPSQPCSTITRNQPCTWHPSTTVPSCHRGAVLLFIFEVHREGTAWSGEMQRRCAREASRWPKVVRAKPQKHNVPATAATKSRNFPTPTQPTKHKHNSGNSHNKSMEISHVFI